MCVINTISSRANNIGSGTWSLIQSLFGIIALLITYCQWIEWKKESKKHFKAEGLSFIIQGSRTLYSIFINRIKEENLKKNKDTDLIDRLERHIKIELDMQKRFSKELLKHYDVDKTEIEVDKKTREENLGLIGINN